MAKFQTVEVAYASENEQFLQRLEVLHGMPIRDVIAMSDVLMRFTELSFDNMVVGIFSKKANLEQATKEGDRIEIYRPLKIDPKQSRRLRAQKEQ